MTLEELSVVFTADIQPYTQAVQALQGSIGTAVQMAHGMSGEFRQAGLNAAAGLKTGLLMGKSGVVSAAISLATAAAEAIREALQIHSPSQVTREMGQMFDEGFLQGMLDKTPRLETQAQQLGTLTEEALRKEVETMPGFPAGEGNPSAAPVHVTVPLEIDGYRLGVAVIENLNRITNATGRVELQL